MVSRHEARALSRSGQPELEQSDPPSADRVYLAWHAGLAAMASLRHIPSNATVTGSGSGNSWKVSTPPFERIDVRAVRPSASVRPRDLAQILREWRTSPQHRDEYFQPIKKRRIKKPMY
jgi:hypothetical protein